MKKIAIILVLLVYTATTMGATIHLHYCMDKFVGWSLWHTDKDNKCGRCGMTEKKDGCCKDEHKQIKIETDHHKSTATHYLQLSPTPGIVTPFVDFAFKAVGLAHYILTSNAPPHIPKERLYILNCVFLV